MGRASLQHPHVHFHAAPARRVKQGNQDDFGKEKIILLDAYIVGKNLHTDSNGLRPPAAPSHRNLMGKRRATRQE